METRPAWTCLPIVLLAYPSAGRRFLKPVQVAQSVASPLGLYYPNPAVSVSFVRIHHNPNVFAGLKFNLDVFVPRMSGFLPVIYFLPGFQATIPAKLYSSILKHLASHGFVVVGVWRTLGSLNSDIRAIQLRKVLTWTQKHLESQIKFTVGWPNKPRPNHAKSTLACHSAGCHIAVSFLVNQGCANFGSLVLMSPVDGKDPFGIVPKFVVTPYQLLPFSIPSLILAAGLDPLPAKTFYPACAPEDLGSMRFFDALRDVPKWYINALEYGHFDLLDKLYATGNQALQLCPANSAIDKSIYRQHLAGTMLAFLGSFENVQTCLSLLPLLQSPTFLGSAVVVVNSTLACDRSRPPIPGADRCASPVR
ncbi:unnamed protein product [Darwinula stevensoni]|uniref:Chlorophyllase n=1 Tax=Darwinula stevensoni TaxID=69355 RepID=A0A7R9A8D0_9CRUS|nr:unnamed protein product [Darwinula stevensoni]CAG0896241.1 unnamed protein product [Darwinula stevensoni]